ncbi:MAG: O-linked N-acetylglucosamine transferase, SPINDLY family protein [Phenylobacterium sp.]
MDERLAAAEAALKAGRGADAIPLLIAALEADPNQSTPVYRVLMTQLYLAGRNAEGVVWGERAVARYPRDLDLFNVLGVLYRRLGRYAEALATLDQAAKINPGNVAVQSNRGNVLLDLDDAVRGEAVFTKLVRNDPRNAEFLRQLGRALAKQGKTAAAMSRARQAVALQKTMVDAWLDMAGLLNDEHKREEAEAILDKALAANPDNVKILEARAVIMRRAQQMRRADAYLTGLLSKYPEAGWLHYQIGVTVADIDRDRANVHLRRAIELAPGNLEYMMALIESLERTRSGDEGANIEESYQLAKRALALKPTGSAHVKILNEVLIRVCAFDELPLLGDFRTIGRLFASTGRHTALLKQLAQVKTLEDRFELLEQHQIWGRMIEAEAAKRPIKRPPPRPRDGKIRLGFMSSDLRAHPVGYFALPLFEHVDPRFEVYCYSFYQGASADRMQEFFASKSTAYRWEPEMNSQRIAQMIADDQLDILFELGGTTHMNKLDVMAYRPAPKQGSWLGYPHSAGLSSIDYLVTDPYNTPPRRDLLIEQPLMMPKSWIALGRMVFSDRHEITPGLPEERNGVLTFGTANNPHKYNREMVEVWARVLAATPGSRFMFIRPEGGTKTFRDNLQAEFARCGIDPDRIVFSTIRGAHMPFYNEVDISLDTFPLTGGTTTTESLWMGVPVVSLIGEAFFERLSASILANSGLGDLATEDKDEFVRIAVALAGDQARRRTLRENMRDQIKAGPLGQTQQFAADFYDLVARTVEPQG